MVRPLVPLIEYYANYEYIAAVLCENRDKPYLECNGKCYLEKQLKKVNGDTHDHKSTIPSISFKDYPISTLDNFSYKLKPFQDNTNSIRVIVQESEQEYLFSILQPPQA